MLPLGRNMGRVVPSISIPRRSFQSSSSLEKYAQHRRIFRQVHEEYLKVMDEKQRAEVQKQNCKIVQSALSRAIENFSSKDHGTLMKPLHQVGKACFPTASKVCPCVKRIVAQLTSDGCKVTTGHGFAARTYKLTGHVNCLTIDPKKKRASFGIDLTEFRAKHSSLPPDCYCP